MTSSTSRCAIPFGAVLRRCLQRVSKEEYRDRKTVHSLQLRLVAPLLSSFGGLAPITTTDIEVAADFCIAPGYEGSGVYWLRWFQRQQMDLEKGQSYQLVVV